jgi:membrane protein implicated in regulation of membrane protease activity
VVGLVLFLAEFVAPGLIIFFFGFGAWTVALVCFVIDLNIVLQLILFLVSSIIWLVVLRRKFMSLFKMDEAIKAPSAADFDDFVGKRVVVTKEIKMDVPGKVEYHGSNWTAVADIPIEEGSTVEIVAKNNITFKVIPV